MKRWLEDRRKVMFDKYFEDKYKKLPRPRTVSSNKRQTMDVTIMKTKIKKVHKSNKIPFSSENILTTYMDRQKINRDNIINDNNIFISVDNGEQQKLTEALWNEYMQDF